jgi:hypothetical protein
VEKDLLRKYFLEGNPRDDRRDCPDEATLKGIAENRLPLNHPARLHLETCSPCFAEFRGFKIEAQDRERRRSILGAVAIAACLVVGILLWKAPFSGYRRAIATPSAEHPVEKAEVTREIDLSGYAATTRGVGEDNVELEAASLPRAIVHLEIILPALSPTGHYKVAVSADGAGGKTVATSEGTATGSNLSSRLSVTLDLRNAPAGSYVLSTEGEQDAGAYYYPLKLE